MKQSGETEKMKTQIITSTNEFIAEHGKYRGLLDLFKKIGAPEIVIVKLERDMARNACKFLLNHVFPTVLTRCGGNRPKARRTRPQAGSERAK